jgi:hypothetical protein
MGSSSRSQTISTQPYRGCGSFGSRTPRLPSATSDHGPPHRNLPTRSLVVHAMRVAGHHVSRSSIEPSSPMGRVSAVSATDAPFNARTLTSQLDGPSKPTLTPVTENSTSFIPSPSTSTTDSFRRICQSLVTQEQETNKPSDMAMNILITVSLTPRRSAASHGSRAVRDQRSRLVGRSGQLGRPSL